MSNTEPQNDEVRLLELLLRHSTFLVRPVLRSSPSSAVLCAFCLHLRRRRTQTGGLLRRVDILRFTLTGFAPRVGSPASGGFSLGLPCKSPSLPLYERGKPSIGPPLYKGETEGISDVCDSKFLSPFSFSLCALPGTRPSSNE
jgi:hypothetical protein